MTKTVDIKATRAIYRDLENDVTVMMDKNDFRVTGAYPELAAMYEKVSDLIKFDRKWNAMPNGYKAQTAHTADGASYAVYHDWSAKRIA